MQKDAQDILDGTQSRTAVGTATVKILPDLSEFQAIIDALPATGLVVTERVLYVHDDKGRVISTYKTTAVTKG